MQIDWALQSNQRLMCENALDMKPCYHERINFKSSIFFLTCSLASEVLSRSLSLDEASCAAGERRTKSFLKNQL
jgi:intracellular septation protein A